MLSRVWIGALACMALPCAAQNPWNGTWTVNSSKSTMKPIPVVLDKTGERYTMRYDSTYKFACDGKAYPSDVAVEVRCHETTNAMTLDLSIPGHLIWRLDFRVASDGKTMSATVSHMRTGKSPSIEKDAYERSGGSGASLVGSWKGTKTTLVTPDSAVLRIHDGFLYYLDTWDGNVADAKLDGTPAEWLDPHKKNEQWSNKLVAPRRIVGHAMVDGKPVNTETLELASDGKSIKVWLGNDESEYEILDKQ